MHKVRTAWPVATRVQYIVAFEDCQRRWGLSTRHFCSAAEIPYSTFARWWTLWRSLGFPPIWYPKGSTLYPRD